MQPDIMGTLAAFDFIQEDDVLVASVSGHTKVALPLVIE